MIERHPSFRDRVRAHPLASYFVLAFALSWIAWVPMALLGARAYQGQAWPSHLPGLFGPAVAAFAISAIVRGRAGVADLARRSVQWRAHWGWWVVAFSPLAFFAIAAVAMAALGQGWPDLSEMGVFSSLPVVAAPLMWLLLLFTSYGEEAGWRGFAVPEMLQRRAFLTTAVVIGLVWIAWHVPSMFVIENYRQLGIAILPAFALGIVAGSILLTWLYRGSGGSVLLATLWHTNYNLVSGTAVAQGTIAAIVSTGVVAMAVVIVVREVVRSRRLRVTSRAKPA